MRQLRVRHLPTTAKHCPVLEVGTTNFSSADPASSHYPTFQPGVLSRQGPPGARDGPNCPILPTVSLCLWFSGRNSRGRQLRLNLHPFPIAPQGKRTWTQPVCTACARGTTVKRTLPSINGSGSLGSEVDSTGWEEG